MNVHYWEQRYIAELVRLGWAEDDARSNFDAGYKNVDEREFLAVSPELSAQDENSYAQDG